MMYLDGVDVGLAEQCGGVDLHGGDDVPGNEKSANQSFGGVFFGHRVSEHHQASSSVLGESGSPYLGINNDLLSHFGQRSWRRELIRAWGDSS